MPGSFEREIKNEIQRLEGRVERLREFLGEMENDIPESPQVQPRMVAPRQQEDEEGGDEGGEGNGGNGGEEQNRGVTSGPRRQVSRPSEPELAQMLMEAPTNKNGSIDLRTDAGRTLRAYGMVDQIGFPTEEAENLLKSYGPPPRRSGGKKQGARR